MKPLIPLIILKAAMLMAIGGDGLVVFAVSVPEYIVGAAIGAWLAKHPFAPPMILSKVAEPRATVPTELLDYLQAHPRLVALASVIVSWRVCSNK